MEGRLCGVEGDGVQLRAIVVEQIGGIHERVCACF